MNNSYRNQGSRSQSGSDRSCLRFLLKLSDGFDPQRLLRRRRVNVHLLLFKYAQNKTEEGKKKVRTRQTDGRGEGAEGTGTLKRS